jgi:hypothetical protein
MNVNLVIEEERSFGQSLEDWNGENKMLVESSERINVIRILDYLLAQNVLKIGSIEGMSDHFPALEQIFNDHLKEEQEKFKAWSEYWGNLAHRSHSTQFITFETCLAESCRVIKTTLTELSHK